MSTLLFLFSSNALSSIEKYFLYNVTSGPSNYGNTGILETPNARFMEEGSMRFNFSSSFPNEFTSLTASPFSWLEATYRYSEIKINSMDLLLIAETNLSKIKALT